MAANIVFLVKGHAIMGQKTRDAKGNIVKSVPARFDFDDAGPSVAVGLIDAGTREILDDPLPQIFGDFDPAGFLAETLRLVKPKRKGNIPDFKGFVKRYLADHSQRECPFLEYCEENTCRDCIVTAWMEEDENA